ncbi:MAG: helix-turn-helix domain-containing protein [Anaerolineae bacterium]
MSNPHPETDNWLTLSQAAKRLNVHPTTLRRWANNGEIPFLLTPGGHRRFALEDILRFEEERRRLRSVVALEQIWAQQALTQTRREIAGRPEQTWLAELDAEERARNRMLGQQLLGLVLQYIASDEANGNIVAEAERLGKEYGRLGIELGLPLTAALEAAMFFRDMLMETAFNLPQTARVQSDSSLRLMRRMNMVLNAVQLAVAEVYNEGS